MDESLSKQSATPALPPWPVSPRPTVTLAPVPLEAAVREYAGFWRRFAASFIDGIIVLFIFGIARDFMTAIGLDRFFNPVSFSNSDQGTFSISWSGISMEMALKL